MFIVLRIKLWLVLELYVELLFIWMFVVLNKFIIFLLVSLLIVKFNVVGIECLKLWLKVMLLNVFKRVVCNCLW